MRLKWLFSALLGLCLFAFSQAEEPAKDHGIVIVDSGGKSVTPKTWKIVTGLRPLLFLPQGSKKEAFAFRELNSTTFADGILTLIPLSRLEKIEYDAAKTAVSVRVAGIEEPLVGTTRFKGINQLVVEAEVMVGAEVAAVKYFGGLPKTGVRGFQFSAAKAAEKVEGDLWSVRVAPEKKDLPGVVQTVRKLQPLYRFGTEEKLLPALMFRKTLKIELANITHLSVGEYHVKEKEAECEVTTREGMTLSLTLLPTITVDGKTGTLVGFLGEVPAGYKLFPVHTITELKPGELRDPEPKKEEPKKEPTKKNPKKEPPKTP